MEISTLINSEWKPIKITCSKEKENINNVYYKKLSGKLKDRVLLIDSFYNLIDIVPADAVSIENNQLYTYIPDRYNTYMSKGITDIRNIYDKYLNTTATNRKITVFTICPTYSCNMACIYCFERRYDTESNLISQENLNQLLNQIANEIINIRKNDPLHKIRIELFGGEPLQTQTKDIVKQILDFGREFQCEASIVTNGFLLCEYTPLLIQYRDLLVEITVTLDGPEKIHNVMRKSKTASDNPFQKIVSGIDLYLKLGIPVNVATNIDKNNAEYITELFDFYRQMNWTDNLNFTAEIGRVYDRPAPKETPNIMSEVDILKIFLELFPDGIGPKWLRFGFLKTTEQVAQNFHIAFNQNEYGKIPFHYCWSTSPVISGYYVDPTLNTFRCTTTVGFSKYSLGNISDTNHNTFTENAIWGNSNVFTHNECLNCPIGGFCGGGCVLERAARGNQVCLNEKKTFNRFIDEIIIPIISKKH